MQGLLSIIAAATLSLPTHNNSLPPTPPVQNNITYFLPERRKELKEMVDFQITERVKTHRKTANIGYSLRSRNDYAGKLHRMPYC